MCALSTYSSCQKVRASAAVGLGAVVDRDDVAARAQSALAGARQQHGVDGVVVLPVVERLGEAGHHAWLSELMAFGRFSVSRPTPLSTLTRMSSFSAVTGCNLDRRPIGAARRVTFPKKFTESATGREPRRVAAR